MKLTRQHFRALRSNTSLHIIVVAGILLEVILAVQSNYTRKLLGEELERHAESELLSKTVMVDHMLNSTEQILLEHAWDIGHSIPQPDSMFNVTRRLIENNQRIVGGCIAFIPNYYPKKGRLFEPYSYKEKGKIITTQLAESGHDYTKHPAFIEASNKGACFWSAPYQYGTDPDNLLITYTFPFKTMDGRIVAICGLDMSLSWLGDTLNSRHIYPSSFIIALTQNGEYVAGPSIHFTEREEVQQIVNLINDSTQQYKLSKSGRSKTLEFKDTDKGPHSKAYIFYTNLENSPYWKMAIICYDDEVYGKLNNMNGSMLVLMLLALVVFGIIINIFLRGQNRLHKANIEQERMSSELRVASNIQKSMLPKEEENEANGTLVQERLDIYGLLVPAKEVGGDLYDYFERNEKLFFCIGDVSGKGMPSALVMAVTHALFRSAAAHENKPARIMQMLNETLCQGNAANMFVTLFIGVLDLPTGRLRYSNAGHNAPLLLTNTQTSIDTSYLDVDANLPIGVFPDFAYTTQEASITPETTIYLYTDGVTEAKNKQAKLFGDKGITDTISANHEPDMLTPRKLLTVMTEAVSMFVKDAQQSDDITMLAIQYKREESCTVLERQLTLTNSIKEVPRLNSFVKDIAEELQLDTKLSHSLRLAIEEAVVNVISYAYTPGTTGELTVKASADRQRLKIVIIDQGTPFDPTVTTVADTTLSAEERPIGGLGILLVQQLMDSINYERTNGQNVLTLSKDYNKQPNK